MTQAESREQSRLLSHAKNLQMVQDGQQWLRGDEFLLLQSFVSHFFHVSNTSVLMFRINSEFEFEICIKNILEESTNKQPLRDKELWEMERSLKTSQRHWDDSCSSTQRHMRLFVNLQVSKPPWTAECCKQRSPQWTHSSCVTDCKVPGRKSTWR